MPAEGALIGRATMMITHQRHPFFQHRSFRFVVVTVAIVLSITLDMGCVPVWAADGASIARGGRLFDNWFLENKDRPPSEIHPKYIIYRPSMHNIETSWRCVSCHGWDYKSRTEQGSGILGDAEYLDPATLASILVTKPTAMAIC